LQEGRVGAVEQQGVVAQNRFVGRPTSHAFDVGEGDGRKAQVACPVVRIIKRLRIKVSVGHRHLSERPKAEHQAEQHDRNL
jgi:hypothetical protein